MEVEEEAHRAFFAISDKQIAIQCISQLTKKQSKQSFSIPFMLDEADSKLFESLEKVLGPYQEQPQILGPHLYELLIPVNDYLMRIIQEMDEIRSITTISNSYGLHTCCKAFHMICRIRGYKHVMKLLPHEVNHIEVCLRLLNDQASINSEHQQTVPSNLQE